MTAKIIPFSRKNSEASPELVKGRVDGSVVACMAPAADSSNVTAVELADRFNVIAEALEDSLREVMNGDGSKYELLERNYYVLEKRYYGFFRECIKNGVEGATAIRAMTMCRLNQGHVIAAFQGWEKYQAALAEVSAFDEREANMPGIAATKARM